MSGHESHMSAHALREALPSSGGSVQRVSSAPQQFQRVRSSAAVGRVADNGSKLLTGSA